MSKLPTRDDILGWIADNPTKTSKRDIARAFGIKGQARIDLKRLLKELEADGHLEKRRKTFREPGSLPPVGVARVLGADPDGDLYLSPVEWEGEGKAPRALFIEKKGDPALAEGDRVLVRLAKVAGEDYAYEARLIRRIGTGPQKLLGIYKAGS
ncbi:MAG: ribonuclease R, partial [Pseudomonadota bacterium]